MKIECHICGKMVGAHGALDHLMRKHPETAAAECMTPIGLAEGIKLWEEWNEKVRNVYVRHGVLPAREAP